MDFLVDVRDEGALAMCRRVEGAAGQAGANSLTAGPSGFAQLQGGKAALERKLFPATSPWFCIHHRADDGARVRLGLRRQGWEIHWPRIIERRPRRDDVIRPFLPGYMFASCAGRALSWHKMLDVPNLIDVVGVRSCGAPIPVPARLVQGLIDAVGGAMDGVQQPIEDVMPVWAPGQRLRVVEGAFAGAEALLVEDRADRRVTVLLTLLGAPREVDLARAAVRSA
jgi:transcriptional antiterminator RfaH